MQRKALSIILVGLVLFSGCSDAPTEQPIPPSSDWMGTEYGSVPVDLDEWAPAGKEDGVGTPGPNMAWDTDDYQVWELRNQWDDVTPEAGLAWATDSGLTWNEKYAAWVASLPVTDEPGGSDRKTFEFVTPHGRTLVAPVLECAEVAIFLRVAFASWYGLPFYLQASDSGKPIYLGHFGFRDHAGNSYGRAPKFRTRYTDYRSAWSMGATWPSDKKLRARGLYGGGDEVSFLPLVNGKPARAGAYFDEIFLNKRVGHFMLLALSWFGSMHLADGANMFHIKANAMQAGDVLLLRWQRRGIGHTVPVMRVDPAPQGRFEVSVATGSMPRRYPTWEQGGSAARYFKKKDAGGPGMNTDEDEYAALGGGIRRWRVARVSGSRYINTFPASDDENWINSRDLEGIAQRIQEFEMLLRELTPEQKRDLALQLIDEARAHLRRYPASCSARSRREDAFADLYAVNEQYFWMNPEQTDAKHRTLEDYVFAKLEYGQSRTCCWNSTTSAMNAIIMDHAREWILDADTQMCREPLVFMARDVSADNDGYSVYRQYAQETDRGSQWVAWSDDESCPQADEVTTDTAAAYAGQAWCDLPGIPTVIPGCGDTGVDLAQAPSRETGVYEDLLICRGETDIWSYTGSGSVEISVTAAEGMGEFDLMITDKDGQYFGGSYTSNVDEKTTVYLGDETTTIVLHVYMPDANTSRGYTLSLEPAPTPASESDTHGSNAAPDDDGP